MHVAVVGAGVIGITTAYFLQKHGCEVTLVDQQAKPAQGCSYANGGFVSAGLSAPWTAPGAVSMAFKAQFDRNAAFKWRPDYSYRQIAWIAKSLRECSAGRFSNNRVRLTRLASYSMTQLHAIAKDVGIDFTASDDGIFQLFRSEVPRSVVDGMLRYLESMSIRARFLPRDEVFALEPALARSTPNLFGALHITEDLSGDCRLFTEKLAEFVEARGGRFLWNTPIDHVHEAKNGRSGDSISYIASRGVKIEADAYVFATGVETPKVLDKRAKLSIYPVKGYSMSAKVRAMENAPRHSMFDFATKMGMARLGDVIRISGIAEVAGYDTRLDARRSNQLRLAFEEAFPGAIDADTVTYWTGLRPTTPDGIPCVGGTSYRNLFVNAGHGGSGWSMSCGSGRLMADIVAGNGLTELNAADYALRG